MSDTAIYIGDEASAAGYRLAGLATIVAEAGSEARAFAQAVNEAALVLVSSAVAARIDVARINLAASAMTPLVAIVPALDSEAAFPDIGAQLRAEIGLAP
jgi:vacuolar-type H+-ATPase subunit F/Vma7